MEQILVLDGVKPVKIQKFITTTVWVFQLLSLAYLRGFQLTKGAFSYRETCCFFSGGPGNVTTSISPTTVLPNGTLVAYRGSAVSFICAGPSGPSQQLTLAFTGAAARNNSLISTSGSLLDFRIKDIQPSDQGTYTCRAANTTSQHVLERSTELLVYCKLPPKQPPKAY